MELETVKINPDEIPDGNMVIKVETETAESDGSHEEEDEDKGQLCRLCANSISTGIYIFSGAGREQNLADKINTCLPVTVKVTDLLPKQLCVPCRNKLNLCYDFAETCVQAEKKLKRIMQIRTIDVPSSGSLTTVYNYFSNNSDRTLTENEKLYCPLCCEGSMILQTGICNAEEIDLIEGSEFDRNGETVEVFVNTKEETFNSMDSVVITDASAPDLVSGFNQLNYNTDPEVTMTITFVCRFCNQFCPDLETIMMHSKYHASNNSFPCVLCDVSFTNQTDVETHFKNHNLEMFRKIGKVHSEDTGHKFNVKDLAKLCKCSDCGKIFGTTERLSFHVQFHNGAKPLVCERCTKEFTSENLLFRHMNLVHGGTEICKKCGATFMSKVKLECHVCAPPTLQPFRCKICNKQFQDTAVLRKHTATHNFILAKPFQCNQCEASFTRVTKLNEHVEQSHCKPITPQSSIKCNVCQAVFPHMEAALIHIEKHSSCEIGEDIKSVEAVEVIVLYCCEYCELVFKQIEDFVQHCAKHTGPNPYLCSFCGMLFPDHNQMKYHKKYHIERENQCDELNLFSVPILFACEACQKSFTSWKGLQIHYNIMHSGSMQGMDRRSRKEGGNVIHLCEDCGESFDKRADLRRHKLKMHRPQNRFPCEECGKVLLHYSGLVIHRRQHTGERPFMCDVCGKSFPQGPAMYTHRRTHTRDYPYRCEICGQTFNNKGDLNNHRRSKHTKERPFKCNVCGKSFLTSGVFYQHKQLHAGIRKYKCTHCDRAFSRWNALSIHIKSHTGEKPHACHVCGRGFAQKGDMKKHMRTQHGVIIKPQVQLNRRFEEGGK